MDLTALLRNSAMAETEQDRRQAQSQLEQAEQSDFAAYLKALVTELNDPSKPSEIRQIAGIVLKNALTARSDALQQSKSQAYLNLGVDVKNYVKEGLLSALVSEDSHARKSAASAIAAVGLIALPQQDWPDLIQKLLNYSMDQNLSDDVKVNTLEAIGYICEMLNPEIVTNEQTNLLLTAIVDAMRPERSLSLVYAGTKALLNTLDFAHSNMENKEERDMIIKVIKDATASQDPNTRTVAFECMGLVAASYYEYLSQYMDAFYHLTTTAIQKDEESVALQAVEFWASVCDTELWMEDAYQDALENDEEEPENKSQKYIEQALRMLVPLLTEHCLMQQDEDPKDTEWNLAMAGGSCLSLMAQCAGDAILPLAMPFVTSNIQDQTNWRKREAAVMTFGSVLDGPSEGGLREWVEQGLPILLRMLAQANEPNEHVRDTTAWAVGLICDYHGKTVEPHLKAVLQSVVQGLSDTPTVAGKNAFAIQSVARFVSENSDDDMQSNALSPYFETLISSLITCAERSDSLQQSLLLDCYEAMNTLVEVSAKDCKEIVIGLLKYACIQLKNAVETNVETTSEKERVDALMISSCSTMLVITQKLDSDILPFADDMAQLAMKVIAAHNPAAQSDAFLVMGIIADAMKKDFSKHMNDFFPLLMNGLRNYEAYQVCETAATVVGDLCRALESDIFQYCNDIVQQLLTNLTVADLNRSVKPPTISAFGDIALAIGPRFDVYLAHVMQIMGEASQFGNEDYEDEDQVEYVNSLREGLIEAYTGIVQGMNAQENANLSAERQSGLNKLNSYAVSILSFLHNISEEVRLHPDAVSEPVQKGYAGLLGDLAYVLGSDVRDAIKNNNQLLEIVAEMKNSEDERAAEVAEWSLQQIG